MSLAIEAPIVLSHAVAQSHADDGTLLGSKLVHGIAEDGSHVSVWVHHALLSLQYHLTTLPRVASLLAHSAAHWEQLDNFVLFHCLYYFNL